MKLPTDLLEEEYIIRSTTPSDINEHLPLLRSVASECDHITEFGVFIANATIGLLASKPKKLIGYDIPDTCVHQKVKDAIALVKKLSAENDVEYVFYEGDVHSVSIEPTEFLFLDTNQREKTLDELEKHHKKVSKYIGSHDSVYLPSQYDAFMKFLDLHSDEWKLKEHRTNNNGLILIERIN